MAKSIKLTIKEWKVLSSTLNKEYESKPSVMMIREVTRRELGFTVRHHRQWLPEMTHFEEHIFLDFWNDEKETFFRLKYL
jgi:hypothetical protein